ncbi:MULTISPECIES: hypothetical protein [Mesorhizobium]|uniref:hypothetical protein n=1 Tax=Mesorhizobium TaxID=68287 RepID=UPI0010A956DE|nr:MULTISPECIES: hypothetical protein [Mesorhizobium]
MSDKAQSVPTGVVLSRMVNEIADNTMLFRAKMAVSPNFAGLSPHSHSIVQTAHNQLKSLENIFQHRANSDIKAVKKLRF